MKDLKYLLAYILPLSTILGLYYPAKWAWFTVILIFGILPVLELFMPASTQNPHILEEDSRSKRIFFTGLLYLNFPLLYGIVGAYLYRVGQNTLDQFEYLGLTLGVGIVVGACGINVAHELGHRKDRFNQTLSKWMLLPALYQHFFIEHNRGHHKNVATPLDPATARYGENLYAFWVRSILNSWLHAWKLEFGRLRELQVSLWTFKNAMVRFTFFNAAYLMAVFFLFNLHTMWAAVAVATVGILLLETVNYLEHYGLKRQKLESGHFEPVQASHSWNSNHELGRIFLYELTRHSDHHYKSSRKYQILRHLDESPQLPFGYPTSLIISLVPPLWFALMHPLLHKTQNQ